MAVMRIRSRTVTIVMAASYLLAVTASASFHHHGAHNNSPTPSGISASHSSDEHACPVCQFLAQKPAPTTDVVPATLSALVREVFLPAPERPVIGVFAAWHSRGPPDLA
jgi:hypothetical protein